MTFGQAIIAMKSGSTLYRGGWNAGIFIKIQFPDEHSKMTSPYIYMEKEKPYTVTTPENAKTLKPGKTPRNPWVASQEDMLADDWLLD